MFTGVSEEHHAVSIVRVTVITAEKTSILAFSLFALVSYAERLNDYHPASF
jgi:hypothetical protein